MQIVWFKRDLRIIDHAPLFQAAQQGSFIPLYIFEPDLWRQPDMSFRQYEFLLECLDELNQDLLRLGQSLVFKVGDAVEVLDELRKSFSITCLRSHQETWNYWTYQRDLRVKKWARQHSIDWKEDVQSGVVRCLKDRNGWANSWFERMSVPIIPVPELSKKVYISSDVVPERQVIGLENDRCSKRQKGGRSHAERLLKSFLYERGSDYTKAMSSPVTAYKSCSRLSPHIAFGTISIKEIFQYSLYRQREIHALTKKQQLKWPSSLNSFLGRLRWHCHFIQKLEDQPNIEFENMHTAYNRLRQGEFNESYFEAWKKGRTGFPMIDACMRALISTGWLNFRMRAMLMSFASYHLWLDWRRPALYLANLFTDYEPGIHYSQVQMQSGTTGINAIRIYNPIKQGIDQDPDGVFIRKWVPELAHLSIAAIHAPWLCSEKVVGYPNPIVDEVQARKDAAAHLYTLRKTATHQFEALHVVEKHASRKPVIRKRDSQKCKNQMEFDF